MGRRNPPVLTTEANGSTDPVVAQESATDAGPAPQGKQALRDRIACWDGDHAELRALLAEVVDAL